MYTLSILRTGDGPCLGIREALFDRTRFGTAGLLLPSRPPLQPLPPPIAPAPPPSPIAPTPAVPIPDGPLGPYRWLLYSQVLQLARQLGSGLTHACALDVGQKSLVGIYSSNCIEVHTVINVTCKYLMLTSSHNSLL